jgi:hypothetical protein
MAPKIIFFTLLAVGAIVVGCSVVIAIYTPAAIYRDSAATNTAHTSQSPSLRPSAATVQTMVETPAEKLTRARAYLESPLTRQSISNAKSILDRIPSSAAEYREGRKLLKEAEAKLQADEAQEAPRIREQLKDDYQKLLSDANPHLNYITAGLTKYKHGFALWGMHEYFSEYTFSIGDDAKVVSAWISTNRSELQKAGILRVGVKSKEGWGGSCWFEV